MNTKKEIFLNQLQFELGDRWPELNSDDLKTIKQLSDFIRERAKINPWHFLRFIPYFLKAQDRLSGLRGESVNLHFDLNTLSKNDKSTFLSFTNDEFGAPLTLRRTKPLKTAVFIFPLVIVLLPMLISTYLITVKSFSGWFYLSGLVGLVLSIGLFSITNRLKNRFEPHSLLEYAKSFYVIHNQTLLEDPSEDQLINFICQAAKNYFGTDFTADSVIPDK